MLKADICRKSEGVVEPAISMRWVLLIEEARDLASVLKL